MAYDFSNIRSIIKSNGIELSKITNSSGGIIWQKQYIWEKYNVVKIVKERRLIISTSLSTFTAPTSGYMYKTAEVNQSTGIIELSDISDAYNNTSPGYWSKKSSHGYWKGFRFTENYDAYFKAGNNYYKYYYSAPVNQEESKGYKLSVSTTYNYEKGTYIENIASTVSDTYPSNGRQGDYWYVKIA